METGQRSCGLNIRTIMFKGNYKSHMDKLCVFVVRGLLCEYCSWHEKQTEIQASNELFSLGRSHELQERDPSNTSEDTEKEEMRTHFVQIAVQDYAKNHIPTNITCSER